MDQIRLRSFLQGAFLAGAIVTPGMMAAQTEPAPTPSSNPMQPTMGSAASQGTPGVNHANSGAYAQDSSANASTGADVQEMRDKMFLHKAMLGGLAEVQLGQLAAEKGSSDDVKRFGQRMVADHTTLNETIKPIAASMNMEPPKKMSKEDQAEYDKLGGLSGADFDKEYLAYMTADHRKDLKEFHREADAARDQALKDAALQGERVIARHTRMVERLNAANGVTVPPPAKQP